MRQTRRLVSVLLVIVAAVTCGRNELSTPTSPSGLGTFPFGAFDIDATAALASLSINPSVFKGGDASRGTVTLGTPAPAGGLTVALAADDTAATVPSSIVVAEGLSSGTFAITSKEVPKEIRILITATAGGSSIPAWIRLTTRTPLVLTVDPMQPLGGDTATATVTIKSAAPTGGAVVRLTSESVDAIVPSSITIAQGKRSGTFTIETHDVSNPTEAWIHATEGGDTGSVQLRIVPKRPASSGSGNGTVTIGGVVN